MNITPADSMGDIDDLARRCDSSDHAMDNTDELIGVSEVAQEGDGNRHVAERTKYEVSANEYCVSHV